MPSYGRNPIPESPGVEERLPLEPGDLVSCVDSLGGFSLSPDGGSVAFVRTTKGDSRIHVSLLSMSRPRRLTGGPGDECSPAWSPDGSLIAFVREPDGAGSSIEMIDPSDGAVRRVISIPDGSCGGLAWSPDGALLAFSSIREGVSDICMVDANGRGFRRLTNGPEQDGFPRWSPDGGRLLFESIMPGPGRRIEVRTICCDGRGLRSIGTFDGACWSPDGGRIALSTTVDICASRVVVIDSETLEHVWGIGVDRLVHVTDWAPGGGILAGSILDGGDSRIVLVDLETGVISRKGPARGICSSPEFTRDGRGLVFLHQGPFEPDGLAFLDLERGRTRQLTGCLPDAIDRRSLSIPRNIHYPSFDGMRIPAYIYRPVSAPEGLRPPAIVWLHGGPNFQFFDAWHPVIQFLQSRGYIVMAPNYRGSTGYGREFCDMKKGDWAGGDLGDVVAAADWLESTGLADGSRIVLWGGSYGGYLTLMTLSKSPGRWAAGIDLFGFTNLETFYRNSLDHVREMVRSQIGTPEENPDFFRDRSPVFNCGFIAAPLLMLHGANDAVVPLSESERFADRMRSLGKTCELKVFEGGDHSFHRTEGQIDYMEAAAGFLDRYVGRM